MKIQDDTGTGMGAKVDKDNRLHTRSISVSQQHAISSIDKQAFQTVSTKAIATSSQNILLLKNTSDTMDLVITYIRLATAGAAATNATAFFTVSIGGDYASGGTAIVPVNMYEGSSNAADGTFFDATASNIVLSGTQNEVDRSHTANTEISYNKEGSLILPKNSILVISHIGSTVAGDAHARVSFYYEESH